MKSNIYFKFFAIIMIISQCIFASDIYALNEGPSVISMDLQDASIKDVLKILSVQSGMNFIASESVKDRKLTLYLDKVPIKDAMDKIFKANNLSYDFDQNANIFIVKDWGKPQLETVTRVFYLKHATVSSSSLKEEESNYIRPGQNSSDSTSSTSSSSSSSSSGGTGTTGKWAVEDDAGITKVIKKILSEHGSVIEDFRTNSLIVTDIPSKMDVIARVIEQLDVPVTQVMMEVEMLDVSKDSVDHLGITWPQQPLRLDMTGTAREVNLFGKHGVNPADREMELADATAGGWTLGPWAANMFGPTILSIVNTQIALDFLKQQTDTKFLARPRILTLNNETAEIKITTNEAIGVKSTTSSSGGSATGTVTNEAERYETGVSLRITPQIDADTGEITMFANPTVSEASTSQTSFDTGTGSTASFLNPETRSAKATVRVKDGETVVLGGLIRNQTSTVIKKYPVLGDMPIFGKLFTHKDVSPGKERELLVFITPHIIKNGDLRADSAKKVPMLQREQAVVSTMGRQQSIKAYLNNFERQR